MYKFSFIFIQINETFLDTRKILITGFVISYVYFVGASKPYCPFFDNRAPEAQPDLSNCTWFKQDSCCRDNELKITFQKMKPLQGASRECVKYLNYLMCYICSPEQFLFYVDQSLSVCESFCNKIYLACGLVTLKGSILQDIYMNGSDFCSSRNFKVIPDDDDNDRGNGWRKNCFHLSEEHLLSDSWSNIASMCNVNLILLSVMLISATIGSLGG